MKILLTGFGPFGDIVDNPSARIVRHFAERAEEDHNLTVRVLPVSFRRADAEIRELLRSGGFDVALLIGVAGNSARFRLELLAANEDRARMPDCDGESPLDLDIVEGAGPSMRTALDVDAIHAALAGRGLPVEVSTDAGRYVCNRTYFAALHEIAESRLATRCLFLHVPPDERSFGEATNAAIVPFDTQVVFVEHLLCLLATAK
jgi:pyroglutamyl-peptidase